MIPLHYFLALFLLLASLMGCVQKAPPGTGGNLSILRQTTDLVDPAQASETRQQIKNRNDLVIRPKGKPGFGTTLILEPFKGDRWLIQLEGDDAEVLFKLLEVEKVESDLYEGSRVKVGRDWTCIEVVDVNGRPAEVSYGCSMEIFNLDGRILGQEERLPGLKVLSAPPELALKSLHRSSYLELDPVTVGKFGRMAIYGNSARKLFESSSVVEESLPDQGIAHHRSGKRGRQMVCFQEFFQPDQTPSYSCLFYFNYNAGSFDEIQVMN